MLEEAFNTGELVQGIEGKVIAELFDAKSGELLQREETHNFISQPALAFLKQAQRTVFKKGMYTLNSALMQDYQQLDKSDASLVLTDLATAEDPANETHMYGKIIGWGSKTTYSGTDALRGSVNAGLSSATATACTWVWDWPTSAANGTINSIGWSKFPTTNALDTSLTNGAYSFASASTINQVYASSQQYNYLAHANATTFYGVYSNTGNYNKVFSLNASFAQTGSFTASQFNFIYGIAWDNANSKLWVIGTLQSTGVFAIASYNASGTLIDGPVTAARNYSGGLAYDGQYLWASVNNNGPGNNTVYRINPATGAEISNFTIPVYSNVNGRYDQITDLSCDQTTSTLWVKVCYSYVSQGIGQSQQLKAFTYSGQSAALSVSLISWASPQTGAGNVSFSGGSSSGTNTYDDYPSSTIASDNDGSFPQRISWGFECIDKYNFVHSSYAGSSIKVMSLKADGLGSRALLGTPITKTNSQTLRITYTINFT